RRRVVPHLLRNHGPRPGGRLAGPAGPPCVEANFPGFVLLAEASRVGPGGGGAQTLPLAHRRSPKGARWPVGVSKRAPLPSQTAWVKCRADEPYRFRPARGGVRRPSVVGPGPATFGHRRPKVAIDCHPAPWRSIAGQPVKV